MTTMDEKIEAIIEELTTRHLDAVGGYPYDHDWIGNILVVAGLTDDNETKISKYTRDELLRWHDRAKAFQRKNPDEDFRTAVYETSP